MKADTKDPGGNTAVCKSIVGLRDKGIEVFGFGPVGQNNHEISFVRGHCLSACFDFFVGKSEGVYNGRDPANLQIFYCSDYLIFTILYEIYIEVTTIQGKKAPSVVGLGFLQPPGKACFASLIF